METSRRNFLLNIAKAMVVVGGSVYLLRTCDAVPDSVAEAWEGPPEDEEDVRHWALAYAILAPSLNNMQPWKVDLRQGDDLIRLYVDEERLQPALDPFARETMMALGGFIESLAIAASQRGFRADISYFPQGSFSSDQPTRVPVADIRLVKDQEVSADPLFAYLLERRTNGQLYKSTPLSAEHQAALNAEMQAQHTAVQFVDDPQEVDELRLLVAKAVGVQMTTAEPMQEFIGNTRIGAGSIEDSRDGNPLHGIPIWWLQKTGRLSEANASTPGSMGYNAIFGDATIALLSTPGFVLFESAGTSRPGQLAIGRAYLRFNLLAASLGVSVQPVNYILADFPEMRGVREEMYHALNKTSYRHVDMLVRIGYALEDKPRPPARRRLEDILITEDAEPAAEKAEG
ncbi:MAG: hypothetical protein R3E95_02915 [Thiolinea sp.]